MFNVHCTYGLEHCLCDVEPRGNRLSEHAEFIRQPDETVLQAADRLRGYRTRWLSEIQDAAYAEMLAALELVSFTNHSLEGDATTRNTISNMFNSRFPYLTSRATVTDAVVEEEEVEGQCESPSCAEDAHECMDCETGLCESCHECGECGHTECDCRCCNNCGMPEPDHCDGCGENICCSCYCMQQADDDGYDQDNGPLRCYSYDVTNDKAFVVMKSERDRYDPEERQAVFKREIFIPWLGVELEVYDSTEDWHSTVPQFEADMMQRLGTAACQDSSLDEKPYSLEWKIAPASLLYHQNIYWPAFERANTPGVGPGKRRRTFRAFDVSSYGLHIHIDRTAFSTTALEKLNLFINHPLNAEFMMDIAQRYSSTWARLQPTGVTAGNMPRDDDKYIGLNFQHSYSVEFRFFKSTTNPNSVMRALEFVDACYRFAQFHATFKTLDHPSFVKMVMSNEYHRDYPRLVRWMVKMGYAVYNKKTREYTVPELEHPFLVLSHNTEVLKEEPKVVPGRLRSFDSYTYERMPLSTRAVCLGYHFETTLKEIEDASWGPSGRVHRMLASVEGSDDTFKRDVEAIGDIVQSLTICEVAAPQDKLALIGGLMRGMPDIDNDLYTALIADVGIPMRNAETIRFLRGVIGQCIEDRLDTRATVTVLRGLYRVFKIVALSDGYMETILKGKKWSTQIGVLLEDVPPSRRDARVFKEFYAKVLPCLAPYNRKHTQLEARLLERTG